jgi:adenylate cyclase
VSDALERRLAAILSADAVGYSRLMGQDDVATVRALGAHRRRIERLIETFRGRLVDAPGDNLLAEFPSAIGSARCAIEIQRAIAEENEALDPERRMLFRIGIHVGDVIVEDGRIYGDGVNIAARLESLADPGGICVSDVVYQQVRGKLDLPVVDLGEQALKNIEARVRAHKIALTAAAAGASFARAAASAVAAPVERPSLAVLPFVSMGGDRAEDYFVDGVFEDIMTELARIPGLFVIGWGAMNTYRHTATSPREVARELGVRYVLEGTVRKEERRARITARLVEGASGRLIWAERYDREIEVVFALQDEIVTEVVTALDVKLVGGENARTARKQLRNPQAIGLLYRGVDLMNRMNREDMRQARALFGELIDMEPDSPIGYIDDAWTHYFDVERGWSEDPEVSLARMSERANVALEKGDVSGYATLMLGHMHLIRREHDEALALSDRALAERPSCQGAYGLKANILNYCGRPEEAIPFARQAIRLTPVAQTFYPEVLTVACYLSGRLEEAIASAHETLALAPDNVSVRVILAAALVETGRKEAAQAVVRDILSFEPRFSLARFAAAQPYRDSAPLDRLLASLRSAGLVDSGTAPTAAAFLLSPSRQRVAPRPRL